MQNIQYCNNMLARIHESLVNDKKTRKQMDAKSCKRVDPYDLHRSVASPRMRQLPETRQAKI